MDAGNHCWVITAAAVVPDEHGLLELHLTVTRPPGSAPPLLAEQRCYKIHPDAAPAILDALMEVAGTAVPGNTEA
jgi:hypothetical protein